MNIKKINTIANEVIDIQLSAIVNFRSTIDKKFGEKIEYLSKIKGRIVVDHNMLATDAMRLMNKNKITNLIVVKKNSYLGMLHIHTILKAGV